MEALDPEELRRFLESQEVVGGGLTFGELEQSQFDYLREIGIDPGNVRVTPSTGTSVVPPEGAGETLFIPRPRGDEPPEGPSEEDLAAQRAADLQARALAQRQTDAFSRLKALLSRVGLSELEGAVQGIITGGTVDLSDSGAIIFALREQPAYQKRFAANAARVKAGLPELDPSTYVGLEEAYRQLMRSNGLPEGFYDQSDDFRKLIESDVSPSELQQRVEQGYRSVRDADPEVKRQMQELYGVSEGQLTAYFLDPDRTAPLLTRQARAAQVAARGRELAGMQLTATSAEDLIARGFSPEEAQQAFTRQGQLSGLYQEMGGEEMLSEQEKLGATFGFDLTAQEKLERRKAQRLGEFQAGGQFARTTGATSGAIETGLGTAQ
jgi:hypothetical protein